MAMKNTICSALAGSLFSFAAYADVIELSSAADFTAKFTGTGEFVLTDDIDLAGSGYTPLAEFSGTLDGDGHTITGLGAQPLITLCKGTVRDLAIDGAVDGENTVREFSGAGVLCDTAQGASVFDCTIKGYTLHHSVEDRLVQNGIGFFAGMASGRLRIERCVADESCRLYQETIAGSKCYNKPIGGIVGRLNLINLIGTDGVAEFVDCTNQAKIVTSQNWTSGSAGAGGIVGVVSQSTSENMISQAVASFRRCVNRSDLENVYLGAASITLGGIVGMGGTGNLAVNPLLDFVDCVNYGRIGSETRGVIYSGGILGHQNGCAVVHMNGCVNRGAVGYLGNNNNWYTEASGGLIGQHDRPPQRADAILIKNCANYASVSGNNVGGLAGVINGVKLATGNTTMSFLNSANYGSVTCRTSSGEMFAQLAKSSDSTETYEPPMSIDNCWTTGPQLYASSLSSPTVTNCRTAEQDDATAVAELKAVAVEKVYALWKIGETTHPEVGVLFAAGEILEPVVQLSEPTVALADDGRSVTLSVSVTNSTLTTGTLTLTVGGEEVETWPLAIGTYTRDISAKKGKTYDFTFLARGSRIDGDAEDAVSGSFVPTEKTNWFTVDFADAGYIGGADWISKSIDKDGGVWSATAVGSTLSGGKVTFAEGSAAVVTYTPKTASEPGADLYVTGSLYVDDTDRTKLPDDAPFAIAFTMDMDKMVCYPSVCANGEWTDFGTDGDGFAAGSWVDYRVDIDHTSEAATQVRVTVGDAVSEWIPLTVATKSVSAVGFTGGGFGSFAGTIFSRMVKNPGLVLIVR